MAPLKRSGSKQKVMQTPSAGGEREVTQLWEKIRGVCIGRCWGLSASQPCSLGFAESKDPLWRLFKLGAPFGFSLSSEVPW